MNSSAKSTSIRLVQITDCHLPQAPDQSFKHCYPDLRLDAVVDAVREMNRTAGMFDHLILSGDLAQGGKASAYARILQKTTGLAQRRHWIPGNHDDAGVMAQFSEMQAKLVVQGDWAILLLNSTSDADGVGGGALSNSELKRLAEVEQLAVKYVLIVLHHPPIEVGSLWQDQIKLANSEAFWRILDKSTKVKGISFGHLHQALHRRRGSVELFCTPATAPQYKVAQAEVTLEDDLELVKPGFRWFNLHADGSITTEVVRVAESIL